MRLRVYRQPANLDVDDLRPNAAIGAVDNATRLADFRLQLAVGRWLPRGNGRASDDFCVLTALLAFHYVHGG
jgi:hypothetical protein